MNLRELFEALPIPIGPMIGDLAKGGKKTAGRDIEKDVGKLAKTAAKSQAVSTATDAIKEKDKKVKHASFCFGRMNPPHYGHQSLFRAVEANSKGGDWFVFTSKSYDKKKNPIPYAEKVEWIQTLNPKLGDHFVTDPSIKTFLQAAAWLYSQGYTSATFVAGDEDMPAMQPPLEQYNGVQSSHGFYKFEPFDFYENPRETSATSARQAAIDNDPKAFAAATKVPSTLTVNGKTLFQAVRSGLGLQETSMKEVNDAVRSLREGSAGKVGKGGTKKIDKEKKSAMKNATTLPGLNMSTGSQYKNYRMGIALAGAPDYPTKMEADNWIGGDPLISSYTQEEYEMVKAAALQVGAGTIENWSGKRSQEMADTNKTSAVAKVKRNKYGI
jgi:hypothetical protein